MPTLDAAPPPAADVATEIARQLAWRGPSGSKQGHVVLTREQAEQVLMWHQIIITHDR
jgi:hypothetical protein